MRNTLPLQRIRLELDRTLRGRPFHGRAVRGFLDPGEYSDLIGQYVALLELLGGAYVSGFLDAARQDLSALSPVGEAAPCAVVQLLHEVRAWLDHAPSCAGGLDIAFAVIGTSWTGDAVEALELFYPGSVRFLGALSERAALSAQHLHHQLTYGDLDPRWVSACAELTRGAILGLATHLDLRWPAPAATLVSNGKYSK